MNTALKNTGKPSFRINTALLALVAMPLLALIIALALDTYHQYAASTAAAYQQAATIRSMSGRQIEQFLVDTRNSLQRMAQRPLVRALNPQTCDPGMAALNLFVPTFMNVVTIDTQERFVCSVLPITEGASQAANAGGVFDDPERAEDFIIGSVGVGVLSNRWGLMLWHIIRDSEGREIGAIGAGIDLLNFKPLVSKESIPDGTVVGIMNGEGVIVARSEGAEQRVGQYISAVNSETIIREQVGAFLGRDAFGQDRLFSFSNIPNSEWYIFVSMDQSVIFAPEIRLAWIRLISAIVVVLGMIVLTTMVARRIARPVEAVSKVVARVGAGNIEARAQESGPQEVRQIAREINAMLDAQRLAEKTIQQSEERFRKAFHSSADAMVITTLADGRFLEVNDSYPSIMGWTRDELQGKTTRTFRIWRHEHDREEFVKKLNQFGVVKNLEAEFLAKDGRVVTGLVSANLMEVNGETCVLSVIRDITAQKEAQDLILHLSFSDSLTGLPNRRLLIDRLGQAIAANNRSGRYGALLFVDIDDFKSINDTLGHDKGDMLLIEVAKRLQHCIQDGDTVSRLGGDGYAVILNDLAGTPDDAATQAEMVCNKLFYAINQAYEFGDATHHRTCSIGITLFGAHQEDAMEPLKRAELAMYESKSRGRDGMHFFDPRMQADVSARAEMEQGLRNAISSQQIQVYYQPQTDDAGRITGVEALVRWNDPERGMISPAEFIPLAETSGLILPIGECVLQQVCEQLVRWSNNPEREHLTIAVNVSARQFHDEKFVGRIQSVLEATRANPQRLVLELTESLLVMNITDVISKMNVLKGMGICFSLDDFGTGYSSLSYLKKLPLDELKIDQAFVRDILIDQNDAAIARMVLALAASMGLSVMAEGVETEEQLERLASLGCHHYQGYLFGRPMPIEALEKHLFLHAATSPNII